ncbi:hypothetical protein Tco_0547556 [Tanacetum coccineum]
MESREESIVSEDSIHDLPNVDNVADIFGVSITYLMDIDVLTKRIVAGDYDIILDGLNKDARKAAMDAIWVLCEKYLDTSTDGVDKPVPTSDQSVFIKTKPGSYAEAAGASSSVNFKGG